MFFFSDFVHINIIVAKLYCYTIKKLLRVKMCCTKWCFLTVVLVVLSVSGTLGKPIVNQFLATPMSTALFPAPLLATPTVVSVFTNQVFTPITTGVLAAPATPYLHESSL